MNDIQLIPNELGDKLDWNFNEYDVVDVNGNSALVSALKHKIMLRWGELEQELYSDKGSRLYETIKYADTESAENVVREILEATIKETIGIADAKVKVASKEHMTYIQEVIIVKNNGEEIEIEL